MKLAFDHFDLIARWYDRLIGRPADDPLPQLLEAAAGQTILDVGGGTGRNTWAQSSLGARVVVCDTAVGMVRQVRAKGLPAVLSSATHLPFADDSADRILVVDAFHHFVQPSPALAQPRAAHELVRVLKPGGRLIIEEPDIARLPVQMIALMERLLFMGSRFWPPSDLRALFVAAGAQMLTETRLGFSVLFVFTKVRAKPAATRSR